MADSKEPETYVMTPSIEEAPTYSEDERMYCYDPLTSLINETILNKFGRNYQDSLGEIMQPVHTKSLHDFPSGGAISQIDLDVSARLKIGANLRIPELSNSPDWKQALSTPQAVANFFLETSAKEGKSLSPLKLIKLVCIAYGWTLAALDCYLFEENLEAWSFGPVVPSLYHEFKTFKREAIARYACDMDWNGELTVPKIPSSQEQLLALLAHVWRIYGNYTASQLVAMTHQPGTPWSRARDSRSLKISANDIRNHYLDLLRTSAKKHV